jgi:hypothetical protein
VECVTEAERLVILVRDVSMVLVDHGMPPILGIPWDHAWLTTSWMQWASSWDACRRPMHPATFHGIRCRPFPVVAFSSRLALVFFFLVYLFYVNILRTLGC